MILAEELGKFTDDKILYLKTEPEISDFTRPFSGKLIVCGQKYILTAVFPSKLETSNFYHQLKHVILTQDKTLIFWNVKNLISYFRFHLPKKTDLTIDSKVIDLKLVEGYFGTKLAPPTSLNEALKRLGPYTQSEECRKIHKEIHKPLAMRVIPAMETIQSVIDVAQKSYVYPSYEIEGQTFGRLACHKEFENCITPHNMGGEQKSLLKIKDDKSFFVYFDFRHMEVSMLQWLSGDPALKQTLDEHEDLYKGIYQNVLGQPCDTDVKRDFIKAIFLPVMFGLQPAGLVEDMEEKGINVSITMASQIHQAIRMKYKRTWEYLADWQEQAKGTPIIKDRFGRPRVFTEKPFRVRGFLVQAASAIFCLDKLIELHDSISPYGNLLYSIHDGYWLVANQENLNKIVVVGLKVLQGASKMFEDLKMKVSCSIGVRMIQMKQIPTNKERNGNN
jgi:hypothetical protein